MKNHPIEYYLGIDGGATKTECALADSTGTVLKRQTFPPCNPFDMPLEKAAKQLETCIRTVCADIPLGKVSLYAGLSGGASGGTREAFARFFGGMGFGKVQNGSDMDTAVAMTLGQGDGICSVIGTGSVTVALQNGEKKRYGGYGYLFDDTLSGYDLGRLCIAAVLQELEGSGCRTLMREAVITRCSGTPLQRLENFYTGGKSYIASFAPVVFDAVAKEDPVATDILTRQCTKLCGKILAAAKTFGARPVDVVFCGGLAAQEHVLAPLFDRLLAENPQISFRFSRTGAVDGALLLAGMPHTVR